MFVEKQKLFMYYVYKNMYDNNLYDSAREHHYYSLRRGHRALKEKDKGI